MYSQGVIGAEQGLNFLVILWSKLQLIKLEKSMKLPESVLHVLAIGLAGLALASTVSSENQKSPGDSQRKPFSDLATPGEAPTPHPTRLPDYCPACGMG